MENLWIPINYKCKLKKRSINYLDSAFRTDLNGILPIDGGVQLVQISLQSNPALVNLDKVLVSGCLRCSRWKAIKLKSTSVKVLVAAFDQRILVFTESNDTLTKINEINLHINSIPISLQLFSKIPPSSSANNDFSNSDYLSTLLDNQIHLQIVTQDSLYQSKINIHKNNDQNEGTTQELIKIKSSLVLNTSISSYNIRKTITCDKSHLNLISETNNAEKPLTVQSTPLFQSNHSMKDLKSLSVFSHPQGLAITMAGGYIFVSYENENSLLSSIPSRGFHVNQMNEWDSSLSTTTHSSSPGKHLTTDILKESTSLLLGLDVADGNKSAQMSVSAFPHALAGTPLSEVLSVQLPPGTRRGLPCSDGTENALGRLLSIGSGETSSAMQLGSDWYRYQPPQPPSARKLVEEVNSDHTPQPPASKGVTCKDGSGGGRAKDALSSKSGLLMLDARALNSPQESPTTTTSMQLQTPASVARFHQLPVDNVIPRPDILASHSSSQRDRPRTEFERNELNDTTGSGGSCFLAMGSSTGSNVCIYELSDKSMNLLQEISLPEKHTCKGLAFVPQAMTSKEEMHLLILAGKLEESKSLCDVTTVGEYSTMMKIVHISPRSECNSNADSRNPTKSLTEVRESDARITSLDVEKIFTAISDLRTMCELEFQNVHRSIAAQDIMIDKLICKTNDIESKLLLLRNTTKIDLLNSISDKSLS